jgi:Fe-S-cluster containining protein
VDRRAEGVTGLDRHFACTQCGACCNRAPELELGEAAELADVFVMRLMLRIYSVPRALQDYTSNLPRDLARAEFYETKRLLTQFAASTWLAKVRRDGRIVEYLQYLSLSVLPLDLGNRRCPALSGALCSIYDRRPLSCQSVPLHYSRPAATAARDLDAFTASPGFLCNTETDAPQVLVSGGIADPAMLAARATAIGQAKHDQSWKAAVVKAMKAGSHGLPTPREVEAQAAHGALTASMLAAWRLGPGNRAEADALLNRQCELIERELGSNCVNGDTAATLREMLIEYRSDLAA